MLASYITSLTLCPSNWMSTITSLYGFIISAVSTLWAWFMCSVPFALMWAYALLLSRPSWPAIFLSPLAVCSVKKTLIVLHLKWEKQVPESQKKSRSAQFVFFLSRYSINVKSTGQVWLSPLFVCATFNQINSVYNTHSHCAPTETL